MNTSCILLKKCCIEKFCIFSVKKNINLLRQANKRPVKIKPDGLYPIHLQSIFLRIYLWFCYFKNHDSWRVRKRLEISADFLLSPTRRKDRLDSQIQIHLVSKRRVENFVAQELKAQSNQLSQFQLLFTTLPAGSSHHRTKFSVP